MTLGSFRLDDSELLAGLADYGDLVEEAVAAVLGILAPELEREAQSGHPWQNRTGAAERGLTADVDRDVAEHIVTLYLQHGDDVEYGWYLEAAPGHRNQDAPPTWEYSVILPVLERNYQRVMIALRELFA